jgi:hypothetical protein
MMAHVIFQYQNFVADLLCLFFLENVSASEQHENMHMGIFRASYCCRLCDLPIFSLYVSPFFYTSHGFMPTCCVSSHTMGHVPCMSNKELKMFHVQRSVKFALTKSCEVGKEKGLYLFIAYLFWTGKH